MLQPLAEYGLHMCICQRIIDCLTVSSELYQFDLLQHSELMGNCALCHIQHGSDITYTQLPG